MSENGAGRSLVRAVVLSGLAVGVLDILDAFIFFGIRNGVAPARILRHIASGALGRASFDMGVVSAALGLLFHFFIAFAIATTYLLAATKLGFLRRNPLLWGPLYGLAVYAFMNLVVVPLSAAPHGKPPAAVLLNGLLIHMFGVGLPPALAARRYLG